VADKTYDSTTTATPTFTISGLIGSQTLTVTGTATFGSSNAGVQTATAQTVSLANGTKGGLASNYSLSAGQTDTATISQKALTASMVVADKTYDSTTTATPTFTITNGLVGSENLVVTGTATFSSANAGSRTATSQTVSLANGTGLASNYSLSAGQTDTATINKATAIVSATKTYDGTTALTSSQVTVTGVAGVSLDFALSRTASLGYYSGGKWYWNISSGFANTTVLNNANVVGATYVSLGNLTLIGGNSGTTTDPNNYVLPASNASAYNAAQVIPKALTATVAAADKTYDGTTTAAVTFTVAGGLVDSQTLVVTGTATFDSANAGSRTATSQTVSLANGTNGGLASNYSLSAGQTDTATINKATLTASMTVAGKTYDATTTATPTFTISSGLVNSQTLVVTGTATFGSSNAGTQTATAQTVSLANGTGLASNYSLSTGQTATATIAKATLTVTGVTTNVTYNASSQTNSAATVTGKQGSDSIIITGYASGSNAGTYNDNLTTGSSAASNYNISYTNGSLVIAKAPLTITGATTNVTYN
ncbi:MAG: hypothetical protein EBS46_03545, partial [Proteobacteria bacterium]|nr:hypothetical protein [Candidatus Fonsibacter sp. PEL4]